MTGKATHRIQALRDMFMTTLFGNGEMEYRNTDSVESSFRIPVLQASGIPIPVISFYAEPHGGACAACDSTFWSCAIS
jgi:hypothetical protein